MPMIRVVRKSNSVLPLKNTKAPLQDDPVDDGDEPVLPKRDPAYESVQSSVYLPRWMWAALEEISATTLLPPRPKGRAERREYSRNEVIEFFLRNRIAAWRNEQKKPKK